jgi:hypothetical protein
MIEQLSEANGGIEPELDSLIRHIEADQSIEIDRMEAPPVIASAARHGQ